MVLDSEFQKSLILALAASAQWPGTKIEEAFELIQAVKGAEIGSTLEEPLPEATGDKNNGGK